MRFQVKTTSLATHRIFGVDGLHPDAREMLEWHCDWHEKKGVPPPRVNEFGRTRRHQEAYYWREMLKLVEKKFQNGERIRVARRLAYEKFSWHCVSYSDGFARAYDLDTFEDGVELYTSTLRLELLLATKQKYPGCEALYHSVTAPHMHFGLPDPAGRPSDWL